MDMTKLTSRKFLMGGGATIWAMFQEETNPTKLYVIGAIVIAYMAIEGLKDWAMAKKAEAEKPVEPEEAVS